MTFDQQHTPYEAIGGDERVRLLVDTFYDRMASDPTCKTVLELHPPDLTSSRQKLYEFLSGWLGGPSLYIEKYGHPRLRGRHMPFAIGDAERDQWLSCMAYAMDELEITGEVRTFLDARFEHVASFMRNREG